MLPFMGERTLETCLKSRIWRWEDGWARCNPRGSYKMKEGGSRIKGDRTMDTEVRVMHTWAMEFGQPPEDGQGKEQRLPESPQEKHSHADAFWISDLQTCKMANPCCFLPLSLWQFVTAAMETNIGIWGMLGWTGEHVPLLMGKTRVRVLLGLPIC